MALFESFPTINQVKFSQFLVRTAVSGKKKLYIFYNIKYALLTTILQLCSLGKKGNAPEVRANTESPRSKSLEELNFLRKLPSNLYGLAL